jgi:hypothetical protein
LKLIVNTISRAGSVSIQVVEFVKGVRLSEVSKLEDLVLGTFRLPSHPKRNATSRAIRPSKVVRE